MLNICDRTILFTQPEPKADVQLIVIRYIFATRVYPIVN